MARTSISITQKNHAMKRERGRHQNALPPDETIVAALEAIVDPATFTQMGLFRQMGLRTRSLGLPTMVAFVLSLIWRQLGSVSEAVRVLEREGLLWTAKLTVTQQSVSARLMRLPAELFENILHQILPQMRARAAARGGRLAEHLEWARTHFSDMLIADASTLDALIKKTGLMADAAGPLLGGKIIALLEVATHLPRRIIYEPDAGSNEQRYWQTITESLTANSLLLIDMGFTNYTWFDRLSTMKIWFITRAKKNMAYTVTRVLAHEGGVRDMLVQIGTQRTGCEAMMRLVEIEFMGKTYQYLTNMCDPRQLPALYVGALYRERWRIEEAFLLVKRLLGLAYFHTTSLNAVQLQLHATWILYAVLVDLCEQVAFQLGRAASEISLEMTYRALYHFTQARKRGETDDLLGYLCDPANTMSLGIVKRKRNKNPKPRKPLELLDEP
jgi:hypothetical protein